MICRQGSKQFERLHDNYYSKAKPVKEINKFEIENVSWTLINQKYWYLTHTLELMRIGMNAVNMPLEKMRISSLKLNHIMYHASPEEIFCIPAFDANQFFIGECVKRAEEGDYTCLNCDYPIELDLDICGNCEFPNPMSELI